jgi:hypothetical protein
MKIWCRYRVDVFHDNNKTTYRSVIDKDDNISRAENLIKDINDETCRFSFISPHGLVSFPKGIIQQSVFTVERINRIWPWRWL